MRGRSVVRRHWRFISVMAMLLLTAFGLFGTTVARNLGGLGPFFVPLRTTHAADFGALVLSGSSWLNGTGVDIFSNTADPTYQSGKYNVMTINGRQIRSGQEWQCVEMVNRLYLTKGWITSAWYGDGDTLIAIAHLPSGLSEQANGAISSLNAGDVITLRDTTTGTANDDGGHAAIINSVTTSNGALTVTFISQNAQLSSTAFVDSGSLSGRNAHLSLNGWSGYSVQAIVHHPSGGNNSNLVKNGGFNQDTSYWAVSGTANFVRYTASSNTGTKPYEDVGFAATNALQANDSVYQSQPISISTGGTYCASAHVVTVGSGTGGGGVLALWLLGGAGSDNSTYTFSNLPSGSSWQPIQTCVTATTGRTSLKVQFYPAVGGATIGIDAVDVHQSLASNAGFNLAGTWITSNANYALYSASSGTGTKPYEGTYFAATNTATSGGSVYQDIPVSINAGDTFCAAGQVVTVGNNTGGAGALALWLTGTNPTEGSSINFSGLPGGSHWTPVKTCVTATASHATVRLQVYPAVNGPTIGLDALDMHPSIIRNGGLNGTGAYWSASGSLSYANYGSGTPTPYEGSGYEAMQASQTNDSYYQVVSRAINAGDTFCADAEVSTASTGSGATGSLVVWLLGGTSNESAAYAIPSLPGNNVWTHIQTCAMATTSHSNIKVQFYPSPGAPVMAVDAVDLH